MNYGSLAGTLGYSMLVSAGLQYVLENFGWRELFSFFFYLPQIFCDLSNTDSIVTLDITAFLISAEF